MDQREFKKLNTGQRLEVLWNEGEVISEKVYYDCNITLFLLDTFYVEVFFNREQRAVLGAEVQEEDQILYNYVKDLGLDELEKLLK